MSENADFVRSICAPWELGDFTDTAWAHPDVEFVLVGGPEPSSSTGWTAMAQIWRGWLNEWEGFRTEVEEIRELDDGRVVALTQ